MLCDVFLLIINAYLSNVRCTFLTVIEMDLCSFNPDEPEEIWFIADHQFVFYIIAWEENGLNVLFSGKFAGAN